MPVHLKRQLPNSLFFEIENKKIYVLIQRIYHTLKYLNNRDFLYADGQESCILVINKSKICIYYFFFPKKVVH